MSRSKRDSAKVRRATHSGSWYSDDADELDSQLSNWLSKAQPLESPARAIIAPHAGYYYSGATAAYSYRQMDPSTIPRFTGALCDGRSGTVPFVVGLVREHRCKRVFILGPSHHVRLSACALTATEKYQTPFYELVVDTKINEELFATGQFETMHVDTDEDEHSIEMHLPYIAKVMESRKGHFTVIPVLVGSLSAEKEQIYGRIFSKYLSSPENFFVISSDFCHWGQRFHYTFYDKTSGEIWQSIEALDKMGMEKIENMDPVGFSDYLRQYQNTICGRFPIGVMLNAVDAIRQNGNGYKMSFKFVKYAQSSQCKSMRDSSVSYAAGALIVQ